MNKSAIGIFGGTFDPIHLGHIYLAEEIYRQLALQEIRFIPCYSPVHRAKPYANPEQRLAMVKLAIAHHAGLVADDREIRRAGASYMVDTLFSLHQEFPEKILYLIMSTDAFAKFTDWQRWQEILELAHLVVVNRPDFPLTIPAPLQQRLTHHPQDLLKSSAGKILLIDLPEFPISATKIRELITQGKEVNLVLPGSVEVYIKAHGLYDSDS